MHAVVARSRSQHRSGEAQSLGDVQREFGVGDEEFAEAMHRV
jgi:hypothetical protein